MLFSDDEENDDDKILDLNSRPAATDSKLGRVQSQVNEVLGDMRINVQKIVERGSNLDELNDRSEELGVSAETFSRRSKGLRKSMGLRTCRARLYVGIAVSLVSFLVLCKIFALSIASVCRLKSQIKRPQQPKLVISKSGTFMVD